MPVFQLFYALAVDIERETRSISGEFKWLRSQVTRSTESVCANMAEGFNAQYSTEYLQSLYRSRREARENQVHLRYAADCAIMAQGPAGQFTQRYGEGLMQLACLIRSIETKISRSGKAKPVAVLREEPDNYLCSLLHQPSTISH